MNQVHNVSTSTALYANTFNESKSEEKKRNEKKKNIWINADVFFILALTQPNSLRLFHPTHKHKHMHTNSTDLSCRSNLHH